MARKYRAIYGIDDEVYIRKVFKINGRSLVLTIPKTYVEKVGLKSGSFVSMQIVGDALVLTPLKTPKQVYLENIECDS